MCRLAHPVRWWDEPGNLTVVPFISAMLSDESRRGWRQFCVQHGVSLSGVLEAAGQIMDERGSLDVETVVDRARIVDDDRRGR